MQKMFNLALKVQGNLKNFYLAGGTTIMFRYKHRISNDLDFFSDKPFSFRRLSYKMRKLFEIEKEEEFTDNIDFFISGIRVSFVFFPFYNIVKTEDLKGLKVAGDYDLFLNKIYAAGKRVDAKDPFDAAFLYKKYNWDRAQIKKDFEKKFPGQSYELFIGALLNFEDYGKLQEWIKTTLSSLIW
jgi:hypothetical protein